MSETITTPAALTGAPAPTAPVARRRLRGGPNRRIVVWARPDFGKSTLALSLVADPADPRWRWAALVDGDESASSVGHLLADPAIARHLPVALDWRQFVDALDSLLPAVSKGDCGAVVLEGLSPLYDYLYGLECAENPDAVEAGGMIALKLRVKPAAFIRAIHSAATRLYQAAPKDSGFVLVITMHAKKTSGMGAPETWAPDLSDGVWDEIWRLTPVAVELDRFGSGAPRIVFQDPSHKIRRIKNSVARDHMTKLAELGTPEDLAKFGTLPRFLDLLRSAEAHAAKMQQAREKTRAPENPPAAPAEATPTTAADAAAAPA